MYAEKAGMAEAVKPLNAAFWRMEHEIEKNFLEPEARRKANQKTFAKNIKALQKEFDAVMENAKPRLEDDERSRVWNRMVLDYLMFKAEAAFAQALEKGLRKVGKKKWNAFRGPIINTVRKLANDAASPEGWLAKRLENPSVADADAIKAFIAEAFGLEPDAIPMGWTSMFDELAKAMEEMAKGVRGYLDWNGPTPTLDLARPTAAGMSMEDASHLTEMMRTPAQPREEAQPEEPTPEPTPTEQVAEQPVAEEQPVEQPQEPAQPKSEWEEREDLDADLEEPFDPEETEGAWRPRESGKPGMENANGEVAYDWKEESGLLVAEEDGETISGGRENFQDEADEALGNVTESLPAVEGNVVYLQTNSLEPGKAPTRLVVFGESAQTIAGALDAANVTYRDNFDSIDEKIDEGKETRDGDAYDESHYKVTISGKKNVQAAIQALVGDNGDYGAVVLQDEGGSIRIMLNPKSVDMDGVTTLAQAQAANEQLKQGIEERNKQAIEAWEARTGLKYDPEWQEHVLRPDGPFRESTGSYIREGTIRNGEWNGEVREYRDGVLRKTAIYKNGSETGTRKLYRGDGTLALDRFFNEDGNAVEIHYGKDGKTEEYRLVLGKRKVLFDSRKQQAEQPQEAPAETVAQPATAAKESWEDKSMEAIVQDIRAIRATPRADHTSPLLEAGTFRQEDGSSRTVKNNSNRWFTVYQTLDGKRIGEEQEWQRLHNDNTKDYLDDFLTLVGTTRYDDNGNPIETLRYDPDGRIHGRERFRSWRDENGEWHTKSVDSFVIDEDGVYITREGVPTEHLPLDVLDESRGQAGNTALSVGDRVQTEAEEIRRAFTRPDGTKRYGWRKAPNGQASSLDEKQWLEAQTPRFKAQYGDWEAAALYNMAKRAWNDPKVNEKFFFRPSERLAKAIEAEVGHPIEQLLVKSDRVRHIKNNHSNEQTEAARGQRALSPIDIATIPYLANNFDSIERHPKHDKNGKIAFKITKRINGVSSIGLLEWGNAGAVTVTMWEVAPGGQMSVANGSPLIRNVQDEPGADINTVQQALAKIKQDALRLQSAVDENGEPLASEVQRVEGELGKPGNTALSVGGFGLNANARAEMEKVRKQYEGTDKWMKAPNGKPTKLNERLWLLVRTPAFKRWFGDWENDPANASKVVDENGEPLVVYHGSENAGFTVFDSDYWDEGMLGNFASSGWDVASTYSGIGIFKGDPDIVLPVRGPALNSEEEADLRPGNYALFLNIRNPLIVDAQGHNWNNIPAEGKDDYVEAVDLTDEQLLSLKEDAWPPIDIELEYDEDGNLEGWSHLELAEAIEASYVQEELDEDENVIGTDTPLFHKETLETTTARQLTQSTRDISNWALRDGSGWDGVIFRNVIDMGQYSGGWLRRESDVFVTKDSPQLKSAVRNTGNFSPTSPDIRLSVGERMGGRAPGVEPGGDVREAGESTLAWLRRKFVHAQTPVFDAVRRVMGVGREPPDALNVEAAAKNVHGKIRARQEMLQRAYLEPLKAILAQPGIDRKRFDDYALALHALERNRMIQERSVVVDPTTGEVVDLGVEAGSGVTNAWAERVIREIQRDPFAEQYKEAANLLAEMNRFVLRGAVADGLLTEAQAKTWMRLSPHYVPLILGRLRAGYRRQDAPGEAWKFGGLEVWLWRPVLVVLLVLFVLPRV